jgi:hypothetical protein
MTLMTSRNSGAPRDAYTAGKKDSIVLAIGSVPNNIGEQRLAFSTGGWVVLKIGSFEVAGVTIQKTEDGAFVMSGGHTVLPVRRVD